MGNDQLDGIEQRATPAIGMGKGRQLCDHLLHVAFDQRPNIRAVDRHVVVEIGIWPDDRLDLAHRAARIGLEDLDVWRRPRRRRADHKGRGGVAEEHAGGSNRPDLVRELLAGDHEHRPPGFLEQTNRLGDGIGQTRTGRDEVTRRMRLEHAESPREPGGD